MRTITSTGTIAVPDEANDRRQKIVAILKAHGIQATVEDIDQAEAFLAELFADENPNGATDAELA